MFEFSPRWALALCHDGVTWGRLDRDNWTMANTCFRGLCPPVTEDNLQELRVFGKEGEVMVWRVGTGFKGRFLKDTTGPAEPYLQPMVEWQILLGIPKEERNSFTRVASVSGREQVLPLTVKGTPIRPPFRLVVKHYLTREDETGIVKVAASRLVDLEVEKNGQA
jgi:CRISPR-associated protein (TIGR03984 family)